MEEEGDRPRERLRREGVEALSLVELLALALRTGASGRPAEVVARDLLQRFGGLDALARAGDAELRRVDGLGPAKIAGLRAAFELGSRLVQAPLHSGARLRDPEQVFAHFGPRLRHCRQEIFSVVLLDARHRVLRDVEIHRGSLDQSLVHPREVFAPALRESAAAIVVIHNHPSGDPTPSREDRDVTQRLVRAGEILGIRVLDHVVIAGREYRSLARCGLLVTQDTREERR